MLFVRFTIILRRVYMEQERNSGKTDCDYGWLSRTSQLASLPITSHIKLIRTLCATSDFCFQGHQPD